MRLRLTCGICDFDAELDEATAAQIELQWDLFTSRHVHTEEHLQQYLDARSGAGDGAEFNLTDDTDGEADA